MIRRTARSLTLSGEFVELSGHAGIAERIDTDSPAGGETMMEPARKLALSAKSEARLPDRQLVDYRNHRDRYVAWLLTFGTDPDRVEDNEPRGTVFVVELLREDGEHP